MPTPDRLNADYASVKIPDVECVEDLLRIDDPIVMAMAATGDREPRSYKGWVKMLTKARRCLTCEEADSRWRMQCIKFWHELHAGETVRNSGAALTAGLKEALL